jgi:NAD(P)-dependent dehydrogenase (short-subunit alcohol dehydrogenase family)
MTIPTDQPNLQDKVVLITGAGSGIGQAMAVAFCSAGARIAACDIRQERVAETVAKVKEMGGVASGHVADVADAEQVARVVSDVLKEHGTVDVLCNNAGVGVWTSLEQTTPESWDRVVAVNARSMFLFVRELVPTLKANRQGAIVNTASVHSFQSWADCCAYAASKGAVLAMTRSMAMELIPFGIRVNAIAPGTIDTRMVRDGLNDPVHPERELETEGKTIPIGRLGRPEEVARAAVFLASPSASFCVGACLEIDGGMLVNL